MIVVLSDPVSLQNFQIGRIPVVRVRLQTAVSLTKGISVDLVIVQTNVALSHA